MKKAILAVLVISILFVFVSTAEANGPGNGKAKGHDKKDAVDNSQVYHDNNGNSGSSKTRKGLDDDKQNQNPYSLGEPLSYHVSKIDPNDEYTVIVKEPGKNGDIVYQQSVSVNPDGTLNTVLTDIPDTWSGVYQVQIVGSDGHMKNDNINIKRERAKDRIPNVNLIPDDNVISLVSFAPYKEQGNDCVTVVFHHSGTVVEFFRWEHRFEPWLHENEILGEGRVSDEGAVQAQIAEGEHIAVFDYNESNGQYTFLGEIVVIGSYGGLIHLWNEGDACSTPYNAAIWCPETSW